MRILCLVVLSTASLCSCGVIKNGDKDNCENLPTANAVSYDQSNIDREMIDAAKINNTALFKCLLQNGANVNAVDSDGISALTYAVAVGNTEIMEYLMKNGANVNASNPDGQTVLMFAAGSAYANAILGKEAHAKMVKYLIDNGSEVNVVTNAGNTALIFASRKGYLDIVKVLVNSGAEIDAVNDQGYSALLWATENQQSDVADYLLDQGANVNFVIMDGSYAGYSAITFAYKRGQDYFGKKLEGRGAIVNTETIFGYCSASDEIPVNMKCMNRMK